MIEGILVLIVTISFICTSAYIDAEHLRDSDWIESHASRVVQRFIFIVALGIYNYQMALASGILIAALFDQALNIMRGLPLLHLGKTAKWDKFWGNRIAAYVVAKLLMVAAALIILFIKWEY